MYRGFEDIISALIKKEQKRRLVIASSDDDSSVEAAIYAYRKNLAEPLFIGDKSKTEAVLQNFGIDKNTFYIENCDDKFLSCKRACRLVREKKADLIMKGGVDSSVFLKAVTDKNEGLGKDKLMSHLAVFEVPALQKIIAVVDGGMIPHPDLNAKRLIIENTVECFLNMGYEKPLVGVVACAEKVNPKIPETIDGKLLKEMNLSGQIKNCIIEGPISFDCAVSEEICRKKAFVSPVGGKADILLLPDINSANICGKTLLTTAGARMAGFVAGGICPVILSSRAASPEEKFYSIILGSAAF